MNYPIHVGTSLIIASRRVLASAVPLNNLKAVVCEPLSAMNPRAIVISLPDFLEWPSRNWTKFFSKREKAIITLHPLRSRTRLPWQEQKRITLANPRKNARFVKWTARASKHRKIKPKQIINHQSWTQPDLTELGSQNKNKDGRDHQDKMLGISPPHARPSQISWSDLLTASLGDCCLAGQISLPSDFSRLKCSVMASRTCD
jgi:hypothetical protein